MSTASKKLKVVIDTNVFISGLNFTGSPSEVLESFINDEIEVYISPFILKEIERILREKFEWGDKRIEGGPLHHQRSIRILGSTHQPIS